MVDQNGWVPRRQLEVRLLLTRFDRPFIDTSYVAERLRKKYRWSRTYAHAVVAEGVKLLILLQQHPGVNLAVPRGLVPFMRFITYRESRNKRQIDRMYPAGLRLYLVPPEENVSALAEFIETQEVTTETNELYFETYGHHPPELWWSENNRICRTVGWARNGSEVSSAVRVA